MPRRRTAPCEVQSQPSQQLRVLHSQQATGILGGRGEKGGEGKSNSLKEWTLVLDSLHLRMIHSRSWLISSSDMLMSILFVFIIIL